MLTRFSNSSRAPSLISGAPTGISTFWKRFGCTIRRQRSGSWSRTVSARIAWPRASRETRRMPRKSCRMRSVQDAFWTVVRKIDMFRGESAFGSWLYRIVANAAYQKLRGRQSRSRDLSLDEVLPSFDAQGRHVGPVADWSPCVDDPSIQTELRMALTAAIDELPPVARTV